MCEVPSSMNKIDDPKPDGEDCEVCGKFVDGFRYRYCCNAFDCGCHGLPADPCICSDECYNAFMNKEPNEL